MMFERMYKEAAAAHADVTVAGVRAHRFLLAARLRKPQPRPA